MKFTKKAFADILEKRLVDRIIFAHFSKTFLKFKIRFYNPFCDEIEGKEIRKIRKIRKIKKIRKTPPLN